MGCPYGGFVYRMLMSGMWVGVSDYTVGVDREISWNELKEGFPPAYTAHVGAQVMQWLRQKEVLHGQVAEVNSSPNLRGQGCD